MEGAFINLGKITLFLCYFDPHPIYIAANIIGTFIVLNLLRLIISKGQLYMNVLNSHRSIEPSQVIPEKTQGWWGSYGKYTFASR